MSIEPIDSRVGALASFSAARRHVRRCPQSDRSQLGPDGRNVPLADIRDYSITSSATARSKSFGAIVAPKERQVIFAPCVLILTVATVGVFLAVVAVALLILITAKPRPR